MATPGSILADVGTDHGYVPIALAQRKAIPRAIALDLRSGPLAHAKENIARFGLADVIETRLSDGVEALMPGEAETIVIAGMGGGVVVHILTRGDAVCKAARELILQPQSEIVRVRKHLIEHGYSIADENMIYEDGKYYPIMRVMGSSGDDREEKKATAGEIPADLAYLYGSCLLAMRHPVLLEYLQKEQIKLQAIENRLKLQPVTEKIQARMKEIARKRLDNLAAQEYMNGRL